MEEIGLIREIFGNDYPELRSLISANPIDGKAKVLRYMKKAKVIATAAGSAKDFLTGETIRQPLTCQSDGQYTWRSDIVYFFEKYNLELPEAFIQKVLAT